MFDKTYKINCWSFAVVFAWGLLIPTRCDANSLTCNERSSVSFGCPCKDSETNDCRFKKLFNGGYIVRDGKLSADNHGKHHMRYEFNENKTHITLKQCIESDEGTYVWMCGKNNINKHFHLEVLKVAVENLQCTVSGKISFEPPCADELDSCRFKKDLQEGDHFIAKDGVLNVQDVKFELDETRTGVTLKECTENDEGTYILTCRNCKTIKQFHLEIQVLGYHQSENLNKASGSFNMAFGVLLVPLCFLFVVMACLRQNASGRSCVESRRIIQM